MAIPITDEHEALLRAFLGGDDDEYDRLCDRPDPPDGQQGFYVLLSAAFCMAVIRRFGHDRSSAGIVRFVAAARGRLGDRANDIDPRDAERLIQAVLLGPTAMAELSETAKEAQVPLLRELITDERLDATGMDEFLTQARDLANKMVEHAVAQQPEDQLVMRAPDDSG